MAICEDRLAVDNLQYDFNPGIGCSDASFVLRTAY
jgi:hypothetical protein